ncbi:MAG: hypothetical protein JWM98_148 [Thermoleophilia bacterium]|nr:hypothetical protein [Thermoleophilia bacterium]
MRPLAHTWSARTPSTALRAVLLVAAVVAASALASLPSSAATSSTVVGATVLSSTSLDKDGCRSGVGGSTLLGALTPGSGVVSSSDCRVVFGSSNDTARLVASQADGTGTAMDGYDLTQTRASDGLRMYDVDMAAANDGWAVGQQGNIRHWDGSAWSVAPSGTTTALTGIAVSATPTIWASTNGGAIRVSSNAGGTWANQYTSGLALNDVDSASSTAAWAVGDTGAIIATSDGATWAPQTSGVTDDLNRVEALSASTAIAVGSNGRILRTTNGGTTWSPVASGVTYPIYGLASIGTWLVAAGSGGAVQSSDGGATWAAFASPPPTYFFQAVALQLPNTIVLFGSTGEIQRSVNGGSSWSRIDSVYDNDYRAATQLGGTTLTSGDGAQLLSSTDSATTLAASPEFRPTFYGVYADGRRDAWSVGSGGVIRHTSDGTTFADQASTTTNGLNDVDGVGASRVWAVGEGGTIVATTNGGATWAPQVSGTTSRIRAVDALDDNRVWGAGSNGVVVRTDNGGGTWQTLTPVAGATLKDVSVGGPQLAWVSGSNGVLRRTTDGGATWAVVTPPAGLGADTLFVAGASADGQRAALGGAGGLVYRTADGGATWSAVASLSGAISINSFDAMDDNSIAVSGSSSTARWTVDGGVTATSAPGGTPTRHTEDISFASTHAIWSSGDSYSVQHMDAGATPVPDFADDAGNTAGADWGTPGATFFGACLRALSSATADTWAVDGNANCTAVDSDPWRAIPASRADPAAVIAHTTTPGASATADLRFGMRAGTAQAAGAYSASVRFEVLAPG